MSSTVTVKFLGDNKGLVSAVDGAAGAVGRFSRAAAATATAVAVAGAAMAASAAKAAVEFESQMGQVFTLLPGISGDAMSEMSDQVLAFSKQMGILPEEVVPALYDSLSAGVPQDNVFEFMEVAGKAAIGGNLEVADAVDLLSTAVNAYAETGLTAAEASDLFFTTVRLGKTTVPELQSSFAQIGPVAAALGVGLDEVGASIATLTASGTPTSVAATQMKAALAELAKEGSKAATAFTEMNEGVSFTEFIESGANLEDVMGIIADSGTPVIEMFGSIDAAQGVLGLIANEGEAFSAALAEMGDSAGATDAAFGVMDATTGRAMDRIKANFAAISIEIGNKLLPIVDRVVTWFVDNMPEIQSAVEGALGPVVDWIRTNVPRAVSAAWDALQRMRTAFMDAVQPVLDTVVPAVETAVDWVGDNLPEAIDAGLDFLEQLGDAFLDAVEPVLDVVVPAIEEAVDWIGEQLPGALDTAIEIAGTIADQWPRVTEAFSATVDWMRSNWPYVLGALAGISVAWLTQVVPAAIAATTALYAQAAAWIAANAPIYAAVAAFAAVGAGLVYLYRNVEWFRDGVNAVKDWMVDDLWPTIQTVWDGILTAIEVAITTAQAVIEAVVAAITWIWQSWGDEITAVAERAWQFVQDTIEAALDVIMGVFDTFVGLFTGDWGRMWDGIKGIVDGALGLITAAASAIWDAVKAGAEAGWDLIKEAVTTAVTSLPGLILDGAAALLRAGRGLLLRVRDGAVEALNTAWDWISGWVTGLPDDIKNLVVDLGSVAATMFGAFFNAAVSALEGLPAKIAELVTDPINRAAEALQGLLNKIPGVSIGLEDEINAIIEANGGTGTGGGTPVDPAANGSIPDQPLLDAAIAAANSGGVFADGGFVGQFRGPNRPVPILAHEGEFVMSREMVENALAAGGRGGLVIENLNVQDGRDIAAELDRLAIIHGTRYPV